MVSLPIHFWVYAKPRFVFSQALVCLQMVITQRQNIHKYLKHFLISKPAQWKNIVCMDIFMCRINKSLTQSYSCSDSQFSPTSLYSYNVSFILVYHFNIFSCFLIQYHFILNKPLIFCQQFDIIM
jgi:hypothetical protein